MSRGARLQPAFLLSLLLCISPAWATGCDQLPAGSMFWVRLSAPVTSFKAKPGTPVKGFLLESPGCDNTPVFPTKTPIEGTVLSVHRVGLGLVHETASLEIGFSRILPSEGTPIEIKGRVKLVDNARETVRNGVIRGIRSTDTPQGMISSRLKYLPSVHLYPDPYLLGYKMLFPIFPDPEIHLLPGTDVQVELAQPAILPSDLPAVEQIPALEVNDELVHNLAELPERTQTKKGKEADVVNIVFAGSRADLEAAFQTAGWHSSKATSGSTVMRGFYSYLSKSSYSTAPMSTQLMNGHKPDLTLEDTFQSHEKRNHLRIWALEHTWEGLPLWASAAVRETGATLSIQHHGFIHHVSEDLDEEREAIVRDLDIAGCVDSVGLLQRPEMEHIVKNATGEYFRTSGSLEIIRLKPCDSDSGESEAGPKPSKDGSWGYRYLRKEILTVRSDLFRANCVYALFDLGRRTVGMVRQRNARREIGQEFRQENAQSNPEVEKLPGFVSGLD